MALLLLSVSVSVDLFHPALKYTLPPCILQSYITISLVSYSSQLAASALFFMSSLNPETLPTFCY